MVRLDPGRRREEVQSESPVATELLLCELCTCPEKERKRDSIRLYFVLNLFFSLEAVFFKMRAFMALIFLAMCVLISVAYQAVQQEFSIRRMKTQIASVTEQVKIKEDEIVSAKLKIQQLNDELSPLTKERDELVKKKEELMKAKGNSDHGLATCQNEKANSEKKKAEVTEAFEKLKMDQQAEEQKAQEEIQGLQKQVLDRDVKLCAFVDQQQAEGRKLCEDKKAAQGSNLK